MIIKSITGSVLFEGRAAGIRKTLEYCANADISMEGADLRKAGLSRAGLDNIRLRGACLWGANLSGADMGYADLRGCDLRQSDLLNVCFSHSDLRGADLRGALFGHTLFDGAALEDIKVSCPTFWDCDFTEASSFSRVSYSHQGEIEIMLYRPPLVVRGLAQRLVLFEGGLCLWGSGLYMAHSMPPVLQKAFYHLVSEIGGFPPRWCFAKREKTYPEEHGQHRRFLNLL